jgi:hypothetical protein
MNTVISFACSLFKKIWAILRLGAKFVLYCLVVFVICILFMRQLNYLLVLGGNGGISATYHPFPSNVTVPVASGYAVSLAKGSVASSFIDWIPFVIFTCLGKSRSLSILAGTALSLILTLTTLGTSVVPLLTLQRIQRASPYYEYNSTSGTFNRTQKLTGDTIAPYSIAFASKFTLIILIGIIAFSRLVLPGKWKLPKHCKPLIRQSSSESIIKHQKENDGTLDQIFRDQENCRRVNTAFHVSLEPRAEA